MKKKYESGQLKRACNVIRADRMGISMGIDEVISKEVALVLNDFFSLSTAVKTTVLPTDNGFEIKILAGAKSVKQLKVVD